MVDLGGWLAGLGLPGLFALGLVDGEAASLLAGALAHRQFLAPETAALTVAAAGVVADNALFAAGRMSSRFPRIARLLTHPRLARLQRRIQQRPASSVVLARFLYGAHGLGTVALGASPLRWAQFAALNGLAVLVWAHLWVWGGHFVVGLFHRLFGTLALELAVPLILLVAIGLWLFWRPRPSGGPARPGR